MRGLEILLVAIGLAMDSFTVSLAVGTTGNAIGRRDAIRLSFHLALFQSLMPILGWYLGVNILHIIAAIDHWIAFGLLTFVGGRMICGAFLERKKHSIGDPSRGLTLVMLSLATSIDALAVGLGLSMLNVTIWLPSLVIGIVTWTMALVAFPVGNRLGTKLGKPMEIAGGLILILIGLRILVTHLNSPAIAA
ncbi:MAG: manganese efflux pump MntP family protein [Anaerolineales bacterium]|jgi:putative Mn2+ efflux pump MntP